MSATAPFADSVNVVFSDSVLNIFAFKNSSNTAKAASSLVPSMSSSALTLATPTGSTVDGSFRVLLDATA